MEKIKTGIVGFGRMAEKQHLTAFRESGFYEVVGVCDVTESRRQLAQTLHLRATDSLDELLSWDLELVLIATNSSAHYGAALQAAAAGKHLFIEKPMAETAQQAEEMVAAARANNVTLMVHHNRHFGDEQLMVKAAVRDGLLGELVYLENRKAGPRPALPAGAPDFHPEWRITASMGGGSLMDWGPHFVEQVLDVMGERKVVRVRGDVRHVKWGDVDDFWRIEMLFDDEVRAIASCCEVSYYNPCQWFIIGTEATLHGPERNGRAAQVVINGPDYELKRSTATEKLDLHQNLAAHIRTGAELAISPEHALRVMQVIQAGRDSSDAGQILEVNI